MCIKPYEKQQENGADFSAAPSSFPLSRRSGNNTVNRRVVFCFPLRRNTRNRFKKIKHRKAPSIRLTNKKKAGIIHIEFLNRYRDAVKIWNWNVLRSALVPAEYVLSAILSAAARFFYGKNKKLRNTGKLVKSDLMKQIEEKRPTAKDISPI